MQFIDHRLSSLPKNNQSPIKKVTKLTNEVFKIIFRPCYDLDRLLSLDLDLDRLLSRSRSLIGDNIYFVSKLIIATTFFFPWIGFCLFGCLYSCSSSLVIYSACLCPFVDLCLAIGCVFVSPLICYDFVCVSPLSHSDLFCLVFPLI